MLFLYVIEALYDIKSWGRANFADKFINFAVETYFVDCLIRFFPSMKIRHSWQWLYIQYFLEKLNLKGVLPLCILFSTLLNEYQWHRLYSTNIDGSRFISSGK